MAEKEFLHPDRPPVDFHLQKKLYPRRETDPMPSLAHRHRQLDFNCHFSSEESSEEDQILAWRRHPPRKTDPQFEEDRLS